MELLSYFHEMAGNLTKSVVYVIAEIGNFPLFEWAVDKVPNYKPKKIVMTALEQKHVSFLRLFLEKYANPKSFSSKHIHLFLSSAVHSMDKEVFEFVLTTWGPSVSDLADGNVLMVEFLKEYNGGKDDEEFYDYLTTSKGIKFDVGEVEDALGSSVFVVFKSSNALLNASSLAFLNRYHHSPPHPPTPLLLLLLLVVVVHYHF